MPSHAGVHPVILAGLADPLIPPFTFELPPSLLPVANRPLLYYQLHLLKLHGFRGVSIVTSQLHRDSIMKVVADLIDAGYIDPAENQFVDVVSLETGVPKDLLEAEAEAEAEGEAEREESSLCMIAALEAVLKDESEFLKLHYPTVGGEGRGIDDLLVIRGETLTTMPLFGLVDSHRVNRAALTMLVSDPLTPKNYSVPRKESDGVYALGISPLQGTGPGSVHAQASPSSLTITNPVFVDKTIKLKGKKPAAVPPGSGVNERVGEFEMSYYRMLPHQEEGVNIVIPKSTLYGNSRMHLKVYGQMPGIFVINSLLVSGLSDTLRHAPEDIQDFDDALTVLIHQSHLPPEQRSVWVRDMTADVSNHMQHRYPLMGNDRSRLPSSLASGSMTPVGDTSFDLTASVGGLAPALDRRLQARDDAHVSDPLRFIAYIPDPKERVGRPPVVEEGAKFVKKNKKKGNRQDDTDSAIVLLRVMCMSAYVEANQVVANPAGVAGISFNVSRQSGFDKRVCTVSPDSVVHPTSEIKKGAVLRASVVGRTCSVEDGARLQRCVVMDHVHIGAGAELADCVVGEGARVEPKAKLTGCQIGRGYVVSGEFENEMLCMAT
ncbi:hypothetical protein KIPB_003810 [Kipferlia bialata]|uniref:Translation initiation factor eIF2B subunit gamma n=1 Tax=Kipferlia bialata TaxID=797122 RepID=A0A9K3CU12_9EUKA|nr:hypothetical protein KIPB_003810 [Kipferlia bialata]|eukprot:g3810.t1